MQHKILLLIQFLPLIVCCQQRLYIKTLDGANQQSISATVTFKDLKKIVITDSTGYGLVSLPGAGTFRAHASAAGFEEKKLTIVMPVATDTLFIDLKRSNEEMEEVVVQSTRTSRTIANVPTRVETIELEEIDEKNNMRPANVAMLLHESTGIQVQQTSAISANSSIRIQGLDGRYTQLLKDGFPNFGNFSSGLSVLEIPPLDLKQVEIIKGPASPLFGGGAIAGVVNFISKTPRPAPEYNFILNQSNIGQTNIGVFAAQKNKKLGYTLLALYSRQQAFDVDDDDFTEVPKTAEWTLHPKLFIYPSEKTVIIIGNSFTSGDRNGGDMFVLKNNAAALHQYFERNQTRRNISTFELETKWNNSKKLVVKQSLSIFNRLISTPGYDFEGKEYNAYSDISYLASLRKHSFVWGGNFVYSGFREARTSSPRDFTNKTGGLYSQHTLDVSEKIKLESGLRADVVNYENLIFSKTEFFLLPRVSVLVRYNSRLSSRISAGIGYKPPTIFTEQAESLLFRSVQSLQGVKSEESYGGTADINFKTYITDQLSVSGNHMFFYSQIVKPLLLTGDSSTGLVFINAREPVHTAGFETNVKLIYKNNLKLFLGYTFTEARQTHQGSRQHLPLVPRHKLNTALVYEKENVIKLGLEGYFTGQQYLTNGEKTSSFNEFGFMAEKNFKKLSIYINFENFTDTRQSRYKNVVNGSHQDPAFDEIWTHTEGFVVNGGIKIKL